MKNKSLEESVLQIQQIAKEKPVTVKELFQVFGGRGGLLLIIFLVIPFCLPVQIPGLSTPFGLAIFFICLRTAFRRKMWLSSSVKNHEINPGHLETISNWGLWLIKKLKPIIHPRLSAVCKPFRLHCVAMAVLALILALPLPIPFTNLFASWPILLISLGLVEDDGLFVLLGYGMAASGFFFFDYIFRFITHYLS